MVDKKNIHQLEAFSHQFMIYYLLQTDLLTLPPSIIHFFTNHNTIEMDYLMGCQVFYHSYSQFHRVGDDSFSMIQIILIKRLMIVLLAQFIIDNGIIILLCICVQRLSQQEDSNQ